MARASKTKALLASAVIEDLTRLVEQRGDLPVPIGLGRTLTTPNRPKVVAAVREGRAKTAFLRHRPLPSDFDTTLVTLFSRRPQ